MKRLLFSLFYLIAIFDVLCGQAGLESEKADAAGSYLILRSGGTFPSSMHFGINTINGFGPLGSSKGLRLQNNTLGNVTIGNTSATGNSIGDAKLSIASDNNETPGLKLEGEGYLTSDGHFKIFLDDDENEVDGTFQVLNNEGERAFAIWEDGNAKVRRHFIIGGGNNSGSSTNGTLTVRHMNDDPNIPGVNDGVLISNQYYADQKDGWLIYNANNGSLNFYRDDVLEVSFSADAQINTISDRREKNSIEAINSSATLNKVLKLNPVSFKYNKSGTGKKILGHIAQEVQKHFPELINDEVINGEDRLTLNTMGLVPLLVSSIQEQQMIINRLSERLHKLESSK